MSEACALTTPPSGIYDMDSNTDSTQTYALRLPAPHDRITISCPRLEDVDEILPILNDVQVYPWMGAGLPHPHKHEHAFRWLKSVKACCDAGQEDLRVAAADHTITPCFRECPVRILRESIEGREAYLGDCGIRRWNFQDIADNRQREQYKQENEAKDLGDPTIVWTIGCTCLYDLHPHLEPLDYLKPSHHGKGIMKVAIGTLVSWAAANMKVRHIRTTAMEGNEPSIRVLEKNGFIKEKILPYSALKAGSKVGLYILDWKATP